MPALKGMGFGLGIFGVITIAAREWALVVPAALTLIGVALYSLPLALWTHWIARRSYDSRAFAATVAAWSICLDMGDCVGFPTKGEGLAAIAFAPTLLGGARFFGSNVSCAILMAGIAGCGVRFAQLPKVTFSGAGGALKPLGISIAALLVASGAAHLSAPAARRTLTVGIPQMNVHGAYFEQRLSLPQLSDAFEDAFAEHLQDLADVDLLALTEAYDGSYPLQVPKVRQRFQNYALTRKQAVLLTSYLISKQGGVYNAVGAIDANGALVSVHRKVNLAPFGEVEFQAGPSFDPASIAPGVRAGILICQEALLTQGPFALARKGANLLISPTSDGSFHSGLLSFEHLALARMRAIETGRSLVWASSAGPSGVVNRWGEFVAGGPFRAPATVRVHADLHEELTPYLRTTWLWPTLALTMLLAFFLRPGKTLPRTSPRPPIVGSLRGIGAIVLALTLTWALAIGSAGAVEVVNGTPERAKRSVLELLHRAVPYLGRNSLERFRTDLEQSASGALAYYLEYYGQRTLPSVVTRHPVQPTLHDLAEELRNVQHFPTREQTYDFSNPPRAPALLRTKSGEFCVATTSRDRRLWLFAPTSAAVKEITIADAAALLEPYALVPESDPELSAWLPDTPGSQL